MAGGIGGGAANTLDNQFGVEVIKWSSLDAGKEQYAYITPQFVQTVRLREKVTRVIEGKTHHFKSSKCYFQERRKLYC